MDNIENLLAFDELAEIKFKNCSGYIHKDHRWVLCLIYYGQEKGLLPKPCDMVIFDAHHDAKNTHNYNAVLVCQVTNSA